MSKLGRLRSMLHEDGWLLTFRRLAAKAGRRFRNRSIGRRLGAANFYCGHAPQLLGLAHIRIGRNFHAGDHVWLHAISAYAGETHTPELTLGDDVTFSDNVHIACLNRIWIGSGALFGSRVIVTDHAHGAYRGAAQSSPEVPPALRPLTSSGSIRIGRNVWLGDGVAVLAGAEIGDGSIIGANSVVTGAIPPATIAVGSPARVIRRWDAVAAQWLPVGTSQTLSS